MVDAHKQDETAELEAILAPFLRTDEPRYRSASWLESPFPADEWIIKSATQIKVNWQIPLPDGSRLTEPRNAALLESLRSWLVARTHVDSTGGKIYSPQSEKGNLHRTLHCIDYLLLRADTLDLLSHGLSGLSSNDLRSMIAEIGSNRDIRKSIYGWPDKLSAYLREQFTTLPDDAVIKAKHIHPDLEEAIPECMNRLTSLDKGEIILARAWLTQQGHYWAANTYRLAPKSSLLVAKIYMGTLFGQAIQFPIPLELCLGPNHRAGTEYPRARVRSKREERMASKILFKYINSINPLALLNTEGLNAPKFSADDLRQFALTIDTKETGRFRTIPQNVAFSSLRSAIEFVIEYGDELVDSYLNLATAALKEGQTIAVFAETRDISSYLTDHCRQLGVCRWSNIKPIYNGAYGATPVPFAKEKWFCSLRENKGLYESLRVLYGAIQITIGILTARRLRELIDLVAGDCLDTSETRLVFRNRKSGIGGLHELEARPIPPIGVRFIKLLEKLQSGLIEIGALSAKTNLFSAPLLQGSVGLITLQSSTYNYNLDIFCDWAEVALDQDGYRYYLRQHQLRRFFAMMFFWGGGFGGMDTLRWYLGHTDIQHLWHYITESTPGATIRSVAAEWAVYGVKHATPEAESLSMELTNHFGTTDFSVLEEDALIMYLEDLMVEGRLIIEPQFLDHGKAYRIAVVLRPKITK